MLYSNGDHTKMSHHTCDTIRSQVQNSPKAHATTHDYHPNRYFILSHNNQNEVTSPPSPSKGSLLIQMVKNNRSFCPPIVASRITSRNKKWTTVVNCKSPLRKFSNTKKNDYVHRSPDSVLLNTNSLFYDQHRVLKTPKRCNVTVEKDLKKITQLRKN